jgi:nicotinamide-nucleotide amidase
MSEPVHIDAAILASAAALLEAVRSRGDKLVTAESCTGGLIAAALTAIPGSSAVVDRGFVTYSDRSKTEMLGVSAGLIEQHGAVSEEVARAMAEGALVRSGASLSVAVTGIAGPDGASLQKPVGLVHLAAMRRGGTLLHERALFGDVGRAEIRRLSVAHALALLAGLL